MQVAGCIIQVAGCHLWPWAVWPQQRAASSMTLKSWSHQRWLSEKSLEIVCATNNERELNHLLADNKISRSIRQEDLRTRSFCL